MCGQDEGERGKNGRWEIGRRKKSDATEGGGGRKREREREEREGEVEGV